MACNDNYVHCQYNDGWYCIANGGVCDDYHNKYNKNRTMKALISYSKNAVNINDARVEVELKEVGAVAQFRDEHGTHSVRLIGIIEYPTEEKTGVGMYRITFENGNTVEDTCVLEKVTKK